MAKILLVDDEPTLLMALAIVLQSEGHELVQEEDGVKAQEMIKSGESFDLGMFDVRMNPVDGIELLKDMKQHSPETEVIMVTAYYTDETAREGKALGAYAYIAKPFSVQDVLETVRSALLRGEQNN